MRDGQAHNIAIAEVRQNGRLARIMGSAATADDDAIQSLVDQMAEDGVDGACVLRCYSERQPSPAWGKYFAAHWPNAQITWSFGPGDDAKMEAAVDQLLAASRKPWWRFW